MEAASATPFDFARRHLQDLLTGQVCGLQTPFRNLCPYLRHFERGLQGRLEQSGDTLRRARRGVEAETELSDARRALEMPSSS